MLMTVKKAISGLNFLIENKHEVKTQLLNPNMLWNKDEPSINGLVETVASLLQRDINSLRLIKKQLLPEQHRTKIICRHPKKMRDRSPDGQWYYMDCNKDL